jgi:hypothetical protein
MGNVIDTLFGGGQKQAYEAYEDALKQAQEMQKQYLTQATGYVQPWQQAGLAALPQYQKGISAMEDPTAFYNKLMGGYTESPAAKLKLEEGIRASQAGASAAGMQGSGAQQKELMKYGQQVVGSDQQAWLDNLMRIYGGYLSGMGGLSFQGSQLGQQMGGWTYGTGQGLSGLQQGIGGARAGQELASSAGLTNLLTGGLGAMAGLGGIMPSLGGGFLGGFSQGYGGTTRPV